MCEGGRGVGGKCVREVEVLEVGVCQGVEMLEVGV